MSTQAEPRKVGPFHVDATFVTVAVIVLALLALFVVNRVQTERANDVRTDELYCTLSGVSPFDRAPNTGKLCADI